MASPRSPFLFVGAVMALLAVAAGAFGAHALRTRLDSRSLELFQTAARYQMYHALALVLTGVWSASGPRWATTVAGCSFAGGVVVFCGSLYALAFGAARLWGQVAPLGGLLFLIGWAALAIAAW